MKKYFPYVGLIASIIFLLISCDSLIPGGPNPDETLDGPIDGLSSEEQLQFNRGDAAFAEVFTASNGLGPVFVATSCASCHAGDGKGHPFTTLTRFGQFDSTGNQYLPQGGPQLQHRAIPGYNPESLPAGAPFAKILPPANTGLGFLDAVSDAYIMSNADPNDANGDGISGRSNWVSVPGYLSLRPGTLIVNSKCIGRFGKKGAAYDLLHQTANAYNQDMGISSEYEAIDTYSHQAVTPEVSSETVNDVVFYLKTLKAPIQRNQNDPDVIAGKNIFSMIGCDKCHLLQMQTDYSPIAALSYKTFYPYTDMLLHDMGPGLDDGYTEGFALTSEWKTPPLWGLGLSKISQGGQYYLMHDGRALGIEAAILLHGGESQSSKNAYDLLSGTDQTNLIKFLESL